MKKFNISAINFKKNIFRILNIFAFNSFFILIFIISFLFFIPIAITIHIVEKYNL